MFRTKTWAPIALRASAIALVAALTGQIGYQATSRAQEVPANDGRKTVLMVCGSCHGSEVYSGLRNNRHDWRAVVDGMRGQGATGTPEQFEQVISYLTSEQGAPLKINQATASDLEAAMELPASEAEAIVAYRESNGRFQAVDDVLNVPDVNSSRVLEQKKNFNFE